MGIMLTKTLTLPAYLRSVADRAAQRRDIVVGPALVMALRDAATELEQRRGGAQPDETPARSCSDWRQDQP